MGDVTVRRGLAMAAVGVGFYLISVVMQAGSEEPLQVIAVDGVPVGFVLIATWAVLMGLAMIAWGLIRGDVGATPTRSRRRKGSRGR